MTQWLYEKEMHQALGLAYQVRNEMGAGWSEEIYHQALVYHLEKASIPARSKERSVFTHRGVEIHTFEPDLILWDKIILELKVLLENEGKDFPSINQAQLFQYLKFHRMSVGALINFAHPKVGVKRLMYEPPVFELDEDYEYMQTDATECEKETLREVRQHIIELARLYGLGYPEALYRTLIAVELQHQNIPCVTDVEIPVTLEGHMLGFQHTPYILVADRVLIHVRASLDRIPKHDFIKTHSYLREMGLKVGWVVNFGRKSLQIYSTGIKY